MNKNQEKTNTTTKYETLNNKELTLNQLEKYQKIDIQSKKIEQYNSSNKEKVFNEAHKIAVKSEKISYEKKDQDNIKYNNQTINKKALDKSYAKTLNDTQSVLTPSSRTFSKIIHNKAIEPISNVIGNTIARPNAILFGAVFSFISTLIIYLVAKKIGYTLSGFEPIIAFIIGWFIGIIHDYFKVMITGKK